MQSALLRLIDAKPFEEISIREIAAEAGVSYPTFFRQYSSKEGLLNDVAAEEIRSVLALIQPVFETGNSQNSIAALCRHIDAHRELWTTLLTAGAASVMRDEFFRIAQEIGREMEQTGRRANPWIPVELAASFVVSGMFEILAWWLRQPSDYPQAEVVAFLEALVVKPTTRPSRGGA